MRCGLIECARNQGGLCLIAGQVTLNENGTCWYAVNATKTEPVRHGRWIERSDKGIFSMTHPYVCNLCGRVEMMKEPYCNCGAKMDGDQ